MTVCPTGLVVILTLQFRKKTPKKNTWGHSEPPMPGDVTAKSRVAETLEYAGMGVEADGVGVVGGGLLQQLRGWGSAYGT